MRETWMEGCMPTVAMVMVQCIYAAIALIAKRVFIDGMSTMVFLVYRQAIATLFLLPSAILITRNRMDQLALGINGFCLVFVGAFIGVTMNQYSYYEGLALSSSSMGAAMSNLVPAVTFLMSLFFRLEKLERSLRSMAKAFGTLICVGGAICMAFYKGSMLKSTTKEWSIGCLSLIANNLCSSLWLILQVMICRNYVDPLSLSAWICILSTCQSAILTWFMEPHLSAWRIKSKLEIIAILFCGIFGSGVTFYLQSWVVAKRGPLFFALFNPLSAVITAVLGVLLFHEELYLGSLLGAIGVIVGLYMVLWGKAEDYNTKKPVLEEDSINVAIAIDPQGDATEKCISEPLLHVKEQDAQNQLQN